MFGRPSFTKLQLAETFFESKRGVLEGSFLANQSQLELGPAAKKQAVSKCASNHGDQPHLQVALPIAIFMEESLGGPPVTCGN